MKLRLTASQIKCILYVQTEGTFEIIQIAQHGEMKCTPPVCYSATKMKRYCDNLRKLLPCRGVVAM